MNSLQACRRFCTIVLQCDNVIYSSKFQQNWKLFYYYHTLAVKINYEVALEKWLLQMLCCSECFKSTYVRCTIAAMIRITRTSASHIAATIRQILYLIQACFVLSWSPCFAAFQACSVTYSVYDSQLLYSLVVLAQKYDYPWYSIAANIGWN